MLTRRIGKLLRGRATPFQIVAACLLGSWIAFVPSFAVAPGLLLAWLTLLLVLNANLGLALLVGIPARLAALAVMPASFQVGRVLIDGPAQPLFSGLVNAPVFAWFGFENYATTGGIVLGALFGIACGVLVTSLLGRARRKLQGLEEGSDRYRQIVARPWMRVLLLLFFGGGARKDYDALLRRRMGNPVRVAGLIAVAVLFGAVWLAHGFLTSPLLAGLAERELARANGATVDLEGLELDLDQGRLTLRGLAMADAEDLDRDLLRAGLVEADVSGADLLRKRLAIDRLAIHEAFHGVQREKRAERVGPPIESQPAPPPTGDEKTLEDYLENARVWKERLAQAREWLDRLGDHVPEGEPEAGEAGETAEERLERRVREGGWASVRAEHLFEEAPMLLVSELSIEGLRTSALDEVIDVHGRNLSTHPHLVEAPPEIRVHTRSDALRLVARLDPTSQDPERNWLDLAWKGLAVDPLVAGLGAEGSRPVEGGTLDLALEGSWSAGRIGWLDLPLRVTLHDSLIRVPGHGAKEVERFELPIELRGPMDDPRISIDDGELVDALTRAGAKELAERLDAEKAELLDEIGRKAEQEVGERLGDEVKDAAKGLFGGSRKKDG